MYERVTPRDWHDAKFAQLDQRVVLKRLWDLENQLEKSTKQHYYVTNGEFHPEYRDKMVENIDAAMNIEDSTY